MATLSNVEVKNQNNVLANKITNRSSHLILSSSGGSKVMVSSSLDILGNFNVIGSSTITGTLNVEGNATVSGNLVVGGRIYDYDSNLILSSAIDSIIAASGSLDFPNQDKSYHIRAVNSHLILTSSANSIICLSSALDLPNITKNYHIRSVNSDLILSSSNSSRIAISGAIQFVAPAVNNSHILTRAGDDLILSASNISFSASTVNIRNQTSTGFLKANRVRLGEAIYFNIGSNNSANILVTPVSGTSNAALTLCPSPQAQYMIIAPSQGTGSANNFGHGVWGTATGQHPKLFIHCSGGLAAQDGSYETSGYIEFYHASSSGGYFGTGLGPINLTPCSGTVNLSGTATTAGLIQNQIVACNSHFILSCSAGSLITISGSLKNQENYYINPNILAADTNLKLSPSLLSHYIMCDPTGGSFILNMPVAASNYGMNLNIKKIEGGGNTITISASDGETIDGAATYVLNTAYEFASLIASGTSWFVV